MLDAEDHTTRRENLGYPFSTVVWGLFILLLRKLSSRGVTVGADSAHASCLNNQNNQPNKQKKPLTKLMFAF